MIVDYEHNFIESECGSFFHGKKDYHIIEKSEILWTVKKEKILPAYLIYTTSKTIMNQLTKKQPLVYLLFMREKLVYVGISYGMIWSRLRTHADDPYKLFTSFAWYKTDNQNVMYDFEKDVINCEQPIYNIKQSRQIKQHHETI